MTLEFAEYFLCIASATLHAGKDTGMWGERGNPARNAG